MPDVRKWLLPLTLLAVYPLLAGFDMSRHSVPLKDILGGGPPKDGIPALINPKFVPADKASFLNPSDRVIGVVIAGEARAYPIRILTWHEIVDDRVGRQPIAVTYCPLTGSALVYDRRLGGREVKFGVSGNLYESNLLMYDKSTESLWSQIKAEAVTGDLTGEKLTALPSVETTWEHWKRQHPASLVLSQETGYVRNYSMDPYRDYERSQRVMFPTSIRDRRLTPKDRVLGIEAGGKAMALPLRLLEQTDTPVMVTLGGERITISYDAASRSVEAAHAGKPFPVFVGYWFAWSTFHPKTSIWRNAKADPKARAQEQFERIQHLMMRGAP